jgi:adenylate cyclase
MAIEDFFNEKTIIDLSFFNFRNSVTAAYFANEKLEIQADRERNRRASQKPWAVG